VVTSSLNSIERMRRSSSPVSMADARYALWRMCSARSGASLNNRIRWMSMMFSGRSSCRLHIDMNGVYAQSSCHLAAILIWRALQPFSRVRRRAKGRYATDTSSNRRSTATNTCAACRGVSVRDCHNVTVSMKSCVGEPTSPRGSAAKSVDVRKTGARRTNQTVTSKAAADEVQRSLMSSSVPVADRPELKLAWAASDDSYAEDC
jgi:hypothetical protein